MLNIINKKTKLTHGKHVLFMDVEYVIIQAVNKTKYKLVTAENYNFYKWAILHNKGKHNRNAHWIIKDKRELMGCEIW